VYGNAASIVLGVVLAFASPCSARAQQNNAQLSSDAACAALKKRLATHDGLATDRIEATWYCDVAVADLPDWWVIGLRSHRQCEGICSNLRGWFAVNRLSGEVREFDVGEFSIGGPVSPP
jgi:hypothetical protein